VYISGRNSGISGEVWSTFAKVDTATQNDVRIHFEGAKAACEQQAGSTAASSFAPAAARSGCLRRSLHILNTSIYLLRRLICEWHSIGCLENVS
jgi:hypothetical protein